MREIARGVSGRLLAGADVAAELGPWSVVLSEAAIGDDAWTCTSQATRQNAYLIAHADGFRLRLDVGRGAWSWRDVEVAVGDRRAIVIRGRGNPEESA